MGFKGNAVGKLGTTACSKLTTIYCLILSKEAHQHQTKELILQNVIRHRFYLGVHLDKHFPFKELNKTFQCTWNYEQVRERGLKHKKGLPPCFFLND